MKLQMYLIWPGCAQGKYVVKAKGFFLAMLRWGNAQGPLEAWSPFAYIPVDPAGNGCFFFSGMRGIPGEATHVWARFYSSDFSSFEDTSAEIPERYLPLPFPKEEKHHFSILTDLHLAAKAWTIKQALRRTESPVIFLLGDSTNDGFPEQFDEFMHCISDTVPDKNFFPVTGNHDVLHPLHSKGGDGCSGYMNFQRLLLMCAEEKGYSVSFAPDQRAYAVQMGDLEIIGLQCVTAGRKFIFPEGVQIDWLEKHLEETKGSFHIILCHAPLLHHNPNRTEGTPYLDRNKRLQEILDKSGNVLFLSGHTHVSPNVLKGNCEFDRERRNIYLDCASVVPTDTAGENGLMASDWKDGCETELTITKSTVEICMRSIESGVKFPRGYYRFCLKP